ncbi:unnamed protein product [Absidia cylindrospora]
MVTSRLVFLLLTCFHLLGLTIFLKGFLLTRQTLSQRGNFYNSWDRFPLISNDTLYSSIYSDASFSLPDSVPSHPAFKRVIVVVIDALRFDFMVQDESQHDKYYRNHLPVISRLQQTQHDNTLLFQFRADPPTTTMQRIKGLMTGSLPTFIDAGSNFASSSVEEDHLLHHLAAQYPYLYFMGDDTWQHLFPAALTPERTFASDSFKMFDLHTVDNRIQEQLWPLLDGTSSGDDWQVVIAHFLGVDHCGHTYGPDHTNMATKLEEMNSVLARIVDHVDEDTLLVVMGDHGMSVEGDHGGESVEELMSGLLLHSGRPLTIDHDLTPFETSTYFDDLIGRMHRTRTSILGYDTKKISQRLHYNASAYPIVPQIHLASTLAYLLHLPIPFGNLGALIPDVLLHSDKNKTATFGDDVIGFRLDLLLHMAQQFRINALQVYDYLITYGMEARHVGFTKNALTPLVQQLENAEETMANAVLKMADRDMQQEHLTDIVTELLESSIFGYDAFLSNTIKYCEAIWAQFDVGCMLLGMVMLGTTTVVGIYFWISHAYWPQIRKWNAKSLVNCVVSCSTWKTIGICALGTIFYNFGSHIRSLFLPYWQGMFDKIGWIDTCACALGLSMMIMVVHHLRGIQQQKQRTSMVLSLVDYDGCLVLAAAIIQALTLGSNSFVIWEDRGTLFAATTLCICWLIREGRALESNSDVNTWTRCLSRPFLVMLWIRLGSVMGQCREEQYPHCSYVDVGLLKQLGSDAAMWWTTLLVSLFGLLLVINVYWISTASLRYFYVVYGVGVLVVYIRVVDDIYQTVFDKGILAYATTTSTYGLAIRTMTQTMIDIYMPRYVYAAFIFGCIYLWNKRNATSAKHQLCLAYICLWSMVLALLQRPLGGMVILLCPYVIHVLALDDDDGTRNKNHHHNNNSTIMIRLALLHTIGHHLFFVTAHQATFTSIPWHAAFIGFNDMYYYIGATLVTMSTLSGYLISWIGTWMVISARQQKRQPDDDNDQAQFYFIFMTLLQYIPTLLSSIFVFILRRHLMTWKIFAPRFLLQALLVTGTFIAHSIFQSL